MHYSLTSSLHKLTRTARYAIRGCCGLFVCDGQPVECCSHQHKVPTLCQCGTAPEPVPGGTFWVDAAAAPGGNGTAASPFSTIAACTEYASRATTRSTCRSVSSPPPLPSLATTLHNRVFALTRPCLLLPHPPLAAAADFLNPIRRADISSNQLYHSIVRDPLFFFGQR